jgi:hypothetical protein
MKSALSNRPWYFAPDVVGLRTIGSLQRVQIPLDALLDLLLALVDLTLGEVAIPRIDCLELATVNGD